jgi:hypothetical protein
LVIVFTVILFLSAKLDNLDDSGNTSPVFPSMTTPVAVLAAGVVMVQYVAASKEVEEKIEGGILHGNTLCVANGAVTAVPCSPVAVDSADIGVTAVAHCPVAVDSADIGVIVVTHFTIAVNSPKQTVATVADVAVALDFTNIGVAAIPHGAVILYFGYHRIVLVTYRLGLPHLGPAQHQEQNYSGNPLHCIYH